MTTPTSTPETPQGSRTESEPNPVDVGRRVLAACRQLAADSSRLGVRFLLEVPGEFGFKVRISRINPEVSLAP
jgi:hypothetical protein